MTQVSASAYKRLLLATSALAAAFAPSALMAQEAAQEAQEAQEATTEEVIVVTGSLITNPNLERSAPVNVTTSDEIELLQSNVAEEILRELPGVVPSIGSAVNNGNNGASFVDLRGLGANRNIVLLDGTRIVPSNFIGRVDLNNIPLALVERVDALTGGASTTYGADAISGVVNFITKNDFAGFELNSGTQITERGDGVTFRVDATIGANFDDGRGNAVFSVGYQEADAVYQGARDFSLNARASNTGAIQGSGASVPSTFTLGTVGRQINPATGALVAPFQSFNFNPQNLFQTPFSRFNMFGSARYEISDAVEVYSRGLFSKNTVKTEFAPSGAFGDAFFIPVSNPFLPAAARAQFCANNDFDPTTPAVETLTPAECAAAAAATGPSDPNYREFVTGVLRRSTEAGPRIGEFVTTMFDYQAGLRGPLTDTIAWDVFGAYGESENTQTLGNYVSLSRLQQALRATNTTSCFEPENGCVPVNLFGPDGSITADMADFLKVASSSFNRTSLAQVRGQVSGDFGLAVPSASDPISFAVGGEYRNYTAQQGTDILGLTPGELGGAGGATAEVDGGYDVYEAFAELVAPIVQDKPFFENLTLEAGIRYSSYTVDAPTSPSFKTTTWKVGGSWEPGAGVKFRGNFAHAVRAPNIGELFTPLTTGLTNLNDDPCASLDNAGDPIPGRGVPTGNLLAVCLAQRAPAASIGFIQTPNADQAQATTGGSLEIEPEKSDSYTLGVVFEPDFAPGLNLSLDYYNIKITDTVGTPSPGDAIDACFANLTAASATDPNCTNIKRDVLTGRLSGSPATVPGLFLPLSNQGVRTTDGIDLVANYRRDIGFAELALSFVGNYTFSSKYQATPSAINRECVGYYSVNCGPPSGLTNGGSIIPKFQFTQRTTLSFETVDLSLMWRHIDAMKVEPLVAATFFPAYRSIDAYNYFDLAARFGVSDNLTVTLSVQNLFDKQPPEVGNTIGSTTYNSGNTFPSTYDALGRKYAAGVRLTF